MKNIKQKIINHKKAIFILAPFLLLIIILILLNSNIIKKLKGSAYMDAGFEDENFYRCVVNGYNNANDTSYSEYDVLPEEGYKYITELHCAYSGIETTQDLNSHDFSKLDTLVLNGNNLSELDLSNVPNITQLDAVDNALTYIDLNNLTNLQQLDLSDNELYNIDINDNRSLKRVNLQNNQLSEFYLKYNENLE